MSVNYTNRHERGNSNMRGHAGVLHRPTRPNLNGSNAYIERHFEVPETLLEFSIFFIRHFLNITLRINAVSEHKSRCISIERFTYFSLKCFIVNNLR